MTVEGGFGNLIYDSEKRVITRGGKVISIEQAKRHFINGEYDDHNLSFGTLVFAGWDMDRVALIHEYQELKEKPNEYFTGLSRKELSKLNRKFANIENFPNHMHFTPFDGRCYSCGFDLMGDSPRYFALGSNITGCPKCHRSYCD